MRTREIGLDCINNCLTDNLRKSSYFFNDTPAWLINLINPSPMYNKINTSQSSPTAFQFTVQDIIKST